MNFIAVSCQMFYLVFSVNASRKQMAVVCFQMFKRGRHCCEETFWEQLLMRCGSEYFVGCHFVLKCVASFVLWYEAVSGLKPKEHWRFAPTCYCQLELVGVFISHHFRFSSWAFSQGHPLFFGCFCVDTWTNSPFTNALSLNCWTFYWQWC